METTSSDRSQSTLKSGFLSFGLDPGAANHGLTVCLDGKVIRMQTHAFEGGYFQDGTKKNTRKRKRREARLSRNWLKHKKERKRIVCSLLAKNSLLPYCQRIADIPNHHSCFKYFEADNIYRLRVEALDKEIPLFAIGSIIYNMTNHRGFDRHGFYNGSHFSSSTTILEDNSNEEEKEMAKKFQSVEHQMNKTDARTHTEWLLDTNSDPTKKRWTGPANARKREWVRDELKKIWVFQSRFHPILTKRLFTKVSTSLFFQYPLNPGDRANCDLEKSELRGYKASLTFQEFRIWEFINNFRVEKEQRKLTEEEREIAFAHLNNVGSTSVAVFKKKIGAKISNYDDPQNKKKKICGNITKNKLVKTIGIDVWESWTKERREEFVTLIIEFYKQKKLAKRLQKHWDFTKEQAISIATIDLEKDTCSYSILAMSKIMPLLRAGVNEAIATNKLYDIFAKNEQALDFIPLVTEVFSNPNIGVSVRELVKMINENIKRCGRKPDAIFIEHIRDVATEKQKSKKTRRIAENEKKSNFYKEFLIENNQSPTRWNVLKCKLAEDQGMFVWGAGSTPKIKDGMFVFEETSDGKPIKFSFEAIFTGELDVEHLIPRSKTLTDNQRVNLVLCTTGMNREVKSTGTPYQAFGHNRALYGRMIDRAKQCFGPCSPKFERFLADTSRFEDDFSDDQKINTAYSARKIVEVASCLYEEPKKHIFVTNGIVTSIMRRAGGFPRKTRSNLMDHSVDACVIALASHSHLMAIKKAKEKAERENHQGRIKYDIDFVNEQAVEASYESLSKNIPSHKIRSRRKNGELHKEQVYGLASVQDDKKMTTLTIRRSWKEFEGDINSGPGKEKAISRILDGDIRQAAQIKFEKIMSRMDKEDDEVVDRISKGDTKAKKELHRKKKKDRIKEAFLLMENDPPLHANGSRVRHPKCTLKVSNVRHIPRGYVKPEGNHHIRYWKDENGKAHGEVVSKFDYIKNPVNPSGLSLSIGEAVVLDKPDVCVKYPELFKELFIGERDTFRVQKMSKSSNCILVRHARDAYPTKMIEFKSKDGPLKRDRLISLSPNQLYKLNPVVP